MKVICIPEELLFFNKLLQTVIKYARIVYHLLLILYKIITKEIIFLLFELPINVIEAISNGDNNV